MALTIGTSAGQTLLTINTNRYCSSGMSWDICGDK